MIESYISKEAAQEAQRKSCNETRSTPEVVVLPEPAEEFKVRELVRFRELNANHVLKSDAKYGAKKLKATIRGPYTCKSSREDSRRCMA